MAWLTDCSRFTTRGNRSDDLRPPYTATERRSMVLLRMRIRVDPAHRAKVVSSLSRILGPSRASAGCVNCQLYADLEDDHVLLFAQEWSDQESLITHLRADNARVLL